jgi:hypothetical protein
MLPTIGPRLCRSHSNAIVGTYAQLCATASGG